MASVGGARGQVDVTLHGRQRFDLPSCPATFPLPQAARRAVAEPPVAAGFADVLFVVVYVGDASHRHHAGLQHLPTTTGSIFIRTFLGTNTFR